MRIVVAALLFISACAVGVHVHSGEGLVDVDHRQDPEIDLTGSVRQDDEDEDEKDKKAD